MKKLLALMLVLLMGLGYANAQNAGGGGMGREKDPAKRAENQVKRMTKQLGLSNDQATSISAILNGNIPKIEKIRTTTKPGSDDRKAQIKELRTSTEAAIKKILTPDQATKFDKLEAQRKEKMKEKLKEKLDELDD